MHTLSQVLFSLTTRTTVSTKEPSSRNKTIQGSYKHSRSAHIALTQWPIITWLTVGSIVTHMLTKNCVRPFSNLHLTPPTQRDPSLIWVIRKTIGNYCPSVGIGIEDCMGNMEMECSPYINQVPEYPFDMSQDTIALFDCNLNEINKHRPQRERDNKKFTLVSKFLRLILLLK